MERIIGKSKLSDYKIKKVERYFCIDINVTKTTILVGLNRKTIKNSTIFLKSLFIGIR